MDERLKNQMTSLEWKVKRGKSDSPFTPPKDDPFDQSPPCSSALDHNSCSQLVDCHWCGTLLERFSWACFEGSLWHCPRRPECQRASQELYGFRMGGPSPIILIISSICFTLTFLLFKRRLVDQFRYKRPRVLMRQPSSAFRPALSSSLSATSSTSSTSLPSGILPSNENLNSDMPASWSRCTTDALLSSTSDNSDNELNSVSSERITECSMFTSYNPGPSAHSAQPPVTTAINLAIPQQAYSFNSIPIRQSSDDLEDDNGYILLEHITPAKLHMRAKIDRCLTKCLLALAVLVSAMCAMVLVLSPAPPVFTACDVRWDLGSLDKKDVSVNILLELSLSMWNPNRFDIEIEGARGDIFFHEGQVARFNWEPRGGVARIGAGHVFDTRLVVSVDWNAVQKVPRLIEDWTSVEGIVLVLDANAFTRLKVLGVETPRMSLFSGGIPLPLNDGTRDLCRCTTA